MNDFSKPIYDEPRKWIRKCRSNQVDWDEIRYARKQDDDGLKMFLSKQEDENFWPSMTVEDWKDLVELQYAAEEKNKRVELLAGIAQIQDTNQDNAVTIPEDEKSSWQLYRQKLLNDGFKEETIDEIEKTTLKILKRLSSDTTETGPIKGLVIGNVQSGKTANMAALMAMAADWGWNMFIVLSGTIENLRIQTQNRLFKDLNQQGTIFWRSLEHLSKNVDISFKAQSLHFDKNSTERYFTVCLKNSSRLSDLIQWLQNDRNKQQQMKILVIDDEADQAGINTANVDAEERKRINGLICSLVNGKNEGGNSVDGHYMAMNYIGYTATPYANILNEDKEDSLYPRNFITTLAVSREYFGPQQIFGYNGDSVNFDGLNIVRTIDTTELEKLKAIHDGSFDDVPEALKDAVAWFLCGVSCMRIWGYRKPVSMLVHTSQKTDHHQFVASVISDWIEDTPFEELISRAKNVWERETTQFTFEDFREQYPTYDRTDDEINRYPSFSEVEAQIRIILDDGITNIPLDERGDLTYHKGVHLCIDNCKNNGISDGMHIRLAYPEPEKMPSPAPAFIVVGGATLSRGLTLEGLMCTFFLRSVGQADTLMQMGRWFRYRKGYELLPRLWVTEKTKQQFEFLAALDQELRDEIQSMDIRGMSPSMYGPKVKNSPKLSFIRITAKNRMQSAQETTMDFSGASNQTYLFDDDPEILRHNIAATEDFIVKLNDESVRVECSDAFKNNIVWKNVTLHRIREYVERFQFQSRLKVFNDVKPLLDWLEKVTEEGKIGTWNVIVAGKNNSKNGTWVLPDGETINKINRSRKANKQEADASLINIGVLRDPRDILSDVDIDGIEDPVFREELEKYIQQGESRGAMAMRDKAGLETTPQLLIYRVDKNSKTSGRGGTREDLNASEDLVGLCFYIPGGRIGTSYASTVSIHLANGVFDGEADLEDIDEN